MQGKFVHSPPLHPVSRWIKIKRKNACGAKKRGIPLLRDLLKQNRSYRGYDESCQISRAELEDLVNCTRYTPSSVNMQPFKYYLACDRETVAKIQPLTKWARALPKLQLPHPGHCPTAFIVICQDITLHPSLQRFQKDVGIVAQTILLAAVEKGLGGCMIGNYNPDEIRQALGLADSLVPMLLIALGKPDAQKSRLNCKKPEKSFYTSAATPSAKTSSAVRKP